MISPRIVQAIAGAALILALLIGRSLNAQGICPGCPDMTLTTYCGATINNAQVTAAASGLDPQGNPTYNVNWTANLTCDKGMQSSCQFCRVYTTATSINPTGPFGDPQGLGNPTPSGTYACDQTRNVGIITTFSNLADNTYYKNTISIAPIVVIIQGGQLTAACDGNSANYTTAGTVYFNGNITP